MESSTKFISQHHYVSIPDQSIERFVYIRLFNNIEFILKYICLNVFVAVI